MSHVINVDSEMSASQADACEALIGFSAYSNNDGLAPMDLGDDDEEDIALVQVIYFAEIIFNVDFRLIH
jgi:hypothetical protein